MKDDEGKDLTIKELMICWLVLLLIKIINPAYDHETKGEIWELKQLLLSRKPDVKQKK